MSLLTQERRVSVRRTVQLCHGLLAATSATVAGAERQRQFRVLTTKITARRRKQMFCGHSTVTKLRTYHNSLHSNGRCDVFYRELYFRREDQVARMRDVAVGFLAFSPRN